VITIFAYQQVPPMVQGLVRDLRVRWALKEAGLEYRTQLLGPGENKQPPYRALQPFGQVPAYREDELVMFESGAIVLHIGAKSTALLPAQPAARARATCWLLAALNTLEPVVQQLTEIDLFFPQAPWANERRALIEQRLRMRLAELAAALGARAYFEERFTAGDLMIATVLRFLRHTTLVTQDPVLGPYLARCEARPAFQEAHAEQLAAFAA